MTGGRLTAGSLCTGYGGLDIAVQNVLGTRLSWCADPGPGPSRILAWRRPEAPNLGDIRNVPWEAISGVDVLCAGWPCEPVSQAGRQKGVDDDRWLWPAVAAAVRRLRPRPRLLVLENVSRLLSVNDGAALGEVVTSLAALGYVGQYGVFRATDAGAPHQRKRVFIVAVAADSRDWAVTQWARHQGRQDRQRPPVRAIELAGDGAGAAADTAGPRRRDTEDPGADRSAPGPAAPPQDRRQAGSVEPERAGGAAADAGSGRSASRGPRKLTGEGGAQAGSRAAALDDRDGCFAWGPYEPAIRRWEAVTGRLAPAPMADGPRGRRLAARFDEWMMGLPDGWVTAVPGLSYEQQIEAIGRGVVPQCAEAAVRYLLGPV